MKPLIIDIGVFFDVERVSRFSRIFRSPLHRLNGMTFVVFNADYSENIRKS